MNEAHTHCLYPCNTIEEIKPAIEKCKVFANGRSGSWCAIPWTDNQDGSIGFAVGEKSVWTDEDVRRIMEINHA